ncbi:hypothetical protein PG993_014920 [Apiospora rasikravindrae]|uniref:Uncharacterized protein n=1 Tax=Apiospora rasikravindrae TaxID=990691 RepID=A0ABR1RQB2_9PEZI
MRALNPNVSKLTTVKEDDASNRLAQPKLRSVSSRRTIVPSTASSSRSSSAPIATTAPATSSISTSKPRPSSRQSAVSNSTLTAANNNNNNTTTTTSRKPGALKPQAPLADSQRPQRATTSTTTSRPPVITTTVTRNPRLAAAAAAAKAKATRPAPLNLSSAPSKKPSAPESSPAVVLSPASTVSTSSRASTSSHATTTPALRSRDQHAPQMTQHSSISKPGRMPLDRSSGTNSNGTPRMPTLSATGARGSTSRAPLTPKIASKAPQAAPAPASARTPLARTQARPTIAGSVANGSSRTTTQPDDDASSFLGSNITPRSAKRQNRVESASTTPNGTPNPERNSGTWDHDTRSGLGLPSSPLHGELPKRASVTFNSMPAEARGQPRQAAQNDPDAKFFYASDAKGTQHHQQAPPVSRPVLAKAPTFFHANGSAVDNKAHQQPPSSPASPAMTHNSSQDSLSGKFMYANGMPEIPTSHPGRTSRPGSMVSTTSRTAPTSRPRPGSQEISIGQRPMSPNKSGPQPSATQARNNNNRPQAASPPQLGPSPAMLRRSSTTTSRKSHSRSSSMVSGSLVKGEPSRNSWISSGPASPSIDAALNPPPLTLASIIQAAEDFDDPDESMSTADDDKSETNSGVQSPTKSTHEAEPVNDLVANARRERKVQDLQITNASLEAINRTLERQLRKQTAELRRFKRLSRAGRLSMMPVESTEAASETASTNGGDEQEVLSDLSEGEEPADEPVEDDSLTDDDTEEDDQDLSASMLEEKDEMYGRKDEKRLQNDLTKHQQLLIDSQKINQSIKRCMDWTEELIKEGRRALEYNVKPSEVEIPGPRVLIPDDEDEDTTQTSISFDFDPDDTINLEEEATGPNAPITPRLAGWNPDANPMERA